MARELLIRPEAEAELVDAHDWYEARVRGLGAEFLSCVDAAFSSIQRSPQQHPLIVKNIHRALLRRFPYGIFFLVEETRIVVIAVFHAKRNPKVWAGRR